MNIKKAIEMLKDYPEDYELVFSDYTIVVTPDVDDPELSDQFVVITDDPITGIVESSEQKEIRFCSERSEKILKQEQLEYHNLH